MLLSKCFYPTTSRQIRSLFMSILIIVNSVLTYSDAEEVVPTKSTGAPSSKVTTSDFNIFLTSIIKGNEIFPFKLTEKQFQLAQPKYEQFTQSKCSEEALDTTYLALQSPKPEVKSGAGTSTETKDLAIASGLITDSNRATCALLNTQIKNIYN